MPKTAMHPNCRISVIVPAYNEEFVIERNLRALADSVDLAGQPLDKTSFEVVVVNNNSTDRTTQIVQDFAQASEMRIVIIDEPKKGVFQAVRTGFRVAIDRGLDRDVAAGNYTQDHIIARTDSDTVVHSQWLASIQQAMDSGAVYVAGGIAWNTAEVDFDALPNAKGLAQAIAETYNAIRQDFFVESWGGNIAIKRSAYLRVGYIDYDYPHDDVAFGYNLNLYGIKTEYLPVINTTSARRIIKNLRNFLLLEAASGETGVEIRDSSDFRLHQGEQHHDVSQEDIEGAKPKWVNYLLVSLILNPLVLFADFRQSPALKEFLGAEYSAIMKQILLAQKERPLNIKDYQEIKPFLERTVAGILAQWGDILVDRLRRRYQF